MWTGDRHNQLLILLLLNRSEVTEPFYARLPRQVHYLMDFPILPLLVAYAERLSHIDGPHLEVFAGNEERENSEAKEKSLYPQQRNVRDQRQINFLRRDLPWPHHGDLFLKYRSTPLSCEYA